MGTENADPHWPIVPSRQPVSLYPSPANKMLLLPHLGPGASEQRSRGRGESSIWGKSRGCSVSCVSCGGPGRDGGTAVLTAGLLAEFGHDELRTRECHIYLAGGRPGAGQRSLMEHHVFPVLAGPTPSTTLRLQPEPSQRGPSPPTKFSQLCPALLLWTDPLLPLPITGP